MDETVTMIATQLAGETLPIEWTIYAKLMRHVLTVVC